MRPRAAAGRRGYDLFVGPPADKTRVPSWSKVR